MMNGNVPFEATSSCKQTGPGPACEKPFRAGSVRYLHMQWRREIFEVALRPAPGKAPLSGFAPSESVGLIEAEAATLVLIYV